MAHRGRSSIGPQGARTLGLATVVAAIVVAAVACSSESSTQSVGGSGPSDPAAGSLTPITVALEWVPNPDHVASLYAEEHGYFADEGLDVTMQPPSGAADSIKLLATNKVDLAFSYEPEMFFAQEQGVPVTAVGASMPVPLNGLIVAADAGIQSPADLAGHKIGTTGIPTDDAMLSAALKAGNLTEDDVTIINIGFNLLTPLLSRRVDAVAGAYRNVEGIQYKLESGTDPVLLPADSFGVPTFSELVVVANSDRLQSDPEYQDSVRAFLAAFVKGVDGAQADPDGATDIVKAKTEYEPTFLEESVPTTLDLMDAPGATACMDLAAWQVFGDWMGSNGLIDGSPDAEAAATNEYLPHAC